MRNKKGFINTQQLKYFIAEIGGGDVNHQWRSLKRLCELFNAGFSISIGDNSKKRTLETLMRGLVTGKVHPPKLLHWAMACLSHISSAESAEFIAESIRTHHDSPDVVSAGIAALFKIDAQNTKTLIKHNDPVFTALAALQSVSLRKFEGLGFPSPQVNIENSDTDALKNALLLVGMNKAPENLFGLNHTNAEIVKELGKYDKGIVTQYSIWAAAKNPDLTVKDIGADLKDIDSFSKEIREYIYMLVAQERELNSEYRDIIIHGIEDEENIDILLAIASGLRGNYDEVLEDKITAWYYDAQHPEVQAAILEFMAVNSGISECYEEIALDAYQNAQSEGQLRLRLKGAIEDMKLPLYVKLRKIDFEEESSLNFGEPNVTNNFNAQNITVGNMASGGNANNNGTVQQTNYNSIKTYLSALKDFIEKQETLPDDKRKEISTVISEAQKYPVKGTLTKLKDALSNAVSVCKDGKELADLGVLYIPALTSLIGNFC